ncbi:MAG TPA: hypothetical protein VGO25_07270 [Rhodanobacteraceae bacterium]|jgi:hypothetical protein|nr:hypothetical protein [Rhodanobacteraceae bacterium]
MHRVLFAVALAAGSLAHAQSKPVPKADQLALEAASAPNAATPAQTSAEVPCSKSAGARKAEEYVQQCLAVSPATHPPCNASNSCELIIDEIKRGCALIETNLPAFCAGYAPGKN